MWELKDAVQHFQQNMTNEQIATALGVHRNMVMNYASGKTKSCSDKVVDNFYDKFKVDGVRVLIAYFASREQYFELRSIRDRAFKVAQERAEGLS